MSILSQALRTEIDEAENLTATFKLGGQEIPVAARPLTSSDFAAVNKNLPVNFQADPTQFEGQVDLLIRKTCIVDNEGEMTDEKAFTKADRPHLMRLKVDILSGMFRDLFGDQVSDGTYDEDAGEDDQGNEVDRAKGN